VWYNSLYGWLGWGVALINKGEYKLNKKDSLEYDTFTEIIAKELGFDHDHNLEHWAYSNPEIWGNPFGSDMFSHASAYNGAKNLKEVVEHLESVQSRLST